MKQQFPEYRYFTNPLHVRRNWMKALLLIFLSGFCCFLGRAQSDLALKLKNADTVMLISHSTTSGSTDDVIDSSGGSVIRPELLIDGKLNRGVVVESRLLSTAETNSLVKVLTYSYPPSNESVHSCFDPHHSIIIIKGDRTSYIDLCFHCKEFKCSDDIAHLQIKNDKWAKLHKFFRTFGLKHELD